MAIFEKITLKLIREGPRGWDESMETDQRQIKSLKILGFAHYLVISDSCGGAARRD